MQKISQKNVIHTPDTPWFSRVKIQTNPYQKQAWIRNSSSFWNMTPFANTCDKAPTIHSLRHTFVVNRMNEWMNEGINLSSMMPYLSKYLGHTSIEGTFYYYHQVDSAFQIVHQKDSLSDSVIPEVIPYEE